MPIKVKTTIEGLNEIKKATDTKHLFTEPFQTFFARVTAAVQRFAMGRAGTQTGRMRDSITTHVQKREPPLWGAVRMGGRVKGVSGRRYPYILEYNPNTKFRSGGLQGHPTRAWFGGSTDKASQEMEAAKDQLNREIERRWQQ